MNVLGPAFSKKILVGGEGGGGGKKVLVGKLCNGSLKI